MKIIGIEQDGHTLHLVKMKNTSLLSNISIPLNPNDPAYKEHVKQLYIWLEKYKRQKVSGLRANQCFLKTAMVNTRSVRSIKKAIPHLTTTLTALDPKDSIYLPVIEKQAASQSKLYFWFTHQKTLQAHLNEQRNFKFEADYVSSYPAALSRFIKTYLPKYPDCLVVHLSLESTTCVVLKNFLPQAFITIDIGKTHIQKAMEKAHTSSNFSDFDFINFPIKNYSCLSKTLEEWKNQLLQFILSIFNDQPSTTPLIGTGFFHDCNHLEEYVLDQCKPHLQKTAIVRNNYFPYAISMGLALDIIYTDQASLQFRQKQWILNKHKSFLAIRLLFLFVISLFFAGLMIGGTKKILKKRIQKMEERTESLLALENRFFPSKSLAVLLPLPLQQKISGLLSLIEQQKKMASHNLQTVSAQAILQKINKIFVDQDAIIQFAYEIDENPSLVKVTVEYETENPKSIETMLQQLSEKQPIITQLSSHRYQAKFFIQMPKEISRYVQ